MEEAGSEGIELVMWLIARGAMADVAGGRKPTLKHLTRYGATVPAGTIVTTGTWCGMLTAQVGDKVKAVFEGIGEAEVQL